MLTADLADAMSARLLRELVDQGVPMQPAAAVAFACKPEWAEILEHGGSARLLLSVWVGLDGSAEWRIGSAAEIVAELESGTLLVDVSALAAAVMAEWRGGPV